MWPAYGNVQFLNYSVKYRAELDNVLYNINADIRPGEKVLHEIHLENQIIIKQIHKIHIHHIINNHILPSPHEI